MARVRRLQKSNDGWISEGHAYMWDPYAEFESATLPNGLTVHSAHWPNRSLEWIGCVIHGGAAHDPCGLEGLSHFVEHVVSRNENINDGAMAAFFKERGGTLFSSTYGFGTSYGFMLPADVAMLAKGLSLFGTMLLQATFKSCIDGDRRVILSKFDDHLPTQDALDLRRRERKALYRNHWLERRLVGLLGDPDAIRRITKDDLQSYYDRHYTPANMSIVSVGGLTLSQLMDLITDSPFAAQMKGARTPLPQPVTEFAPSVETRFIFRIPQDTPQESLPKACFYQSVARIPGIVNPRAIDILDMMINIVVRAAIRVERAWTYKIEASSVIGPDFVEFSIDCESFAETAVDQIEEVIDGCIASLTDRQDLYEQVKARLIADRFMTDVTAGEICRGAMGDLRDYHRIISLAEEMRDFERVTMEDIRGLVHWLQPEWRWTLIKRP